MHRPLFIAAFLAGTCVFAPAAEPNPCTLFRIDTLRVRPHPRSRVVDGEIKGKRSGILLDTSAWRSVIDPGAARRLELPLTRRPGYRWSAAGAEGSVEVAMIDELKLGQGSRKDLSVLVAAKELGGDVALILGHHFFQPVDVCFDLANNKWNPFRAVNCGGSNLAYWAKG